jgi:hypothetical protein
MYMSRKRPTLTHEAAFLGAITGVLICATALGIGWLWSINTLFSP